MLVSRGGEVRASAPDRDRARVLRALGAKVAVGDPSGEDVLWPLLQDAHTLCHLAADPLAADGDTERINLKVVEAVLTAAAAAGIRRLLLLSSVGASPGSPNPTLRALGRAEALVSGAGLEHVILRTTHVVGEGSAWMILTALLARRRPPVVVGPGTQVMAPVLAEDVARVLVAADHRAEAVDGTLAAAGPERLTADRVADLIAGRTRRWKRHVDRVPGLGDAAARILAADSLPDAPDACARFAVIPSSAFPLPQGPGGGGG
jgi:uncharacterized protein YbjT (DUF2867 family)